MVVSLVEQLDKGRELSYDTLMNIHERLAISKDPFMMYAAGWAAMYATQKGTNLDPTGTFEVAREFWNEVSTDGTSFYNNEPLVLSAQGLLCFRLASQIRYERQVWQDQERQQTYQDLGDVASILSPCASHEHPKCLGMLAEVACMQVLWRQTPNKPLNVVPAGPGKDARRKGAHKFNTDLYAYVPGMPSKLKGVNIQVKTSLKPQDRDQYYPRMALIGASTHFVHPDHIASADERVRYVANCCHNEAANNTAASNVSNLDSTSSNVYVEVVKKLNPGVELSYWGN